MDGTVEHLGADPHPREAERLRALWVTGMLDTPPETLFDDLTALAAQICGTPVSLVSLVDMDRQFFKSHHGTEMCESERSASICAHTILGDGVLVIEDATLDHRTLTNPLVTGDTALRFYAGAPLIGRDGLPYGSLCVIDFVPRSLSSEQVEALERLARQAVYLLESGRVTRERTEALETAEVLRSEIDHRVANSLQQVSALLRLQSRVMRDPAAKAALLDSRSRVDAISSFHRTVSALSDGRQMDIATLLTRLGEGLGEGLPENVRLELDLTEFTTSARFGLHLALILNEFVTNSLKYAFPDGREGVIRVSDRLEGDDVVLEFVDDGAGWEGEMPESASSGIGMRVIESAVEMLQGRFDISGEGGCRMVVRFPRSAPL